MGIRGKDFQIPVPISSLHFWKNERRKKRFSLPFPFLKNGVGRENEEKNGHVRFRILFEQGKREDDREKAMLFSSPLSSVFLSLFIIRRGMRK